MAWGSPRYLTQMEPTQAQDEPQPVSQDPTSWAVPSFYIPEVAWQPI